MEEITLDDLDYRILNLIANDARISFLEVSRICNLSGATVHQRVQKMMAGGIIAGSEFRLDLKKIGYQTCAFLSLHFNETVDIGRVSINSKISGKLSNVILLRGNTIFL